MSIKTAITKKMISNSINNGFVTVNKNITSYLDLAGQFYKTLQNVDKIPKNDALKTALQTMLSSEKISDATFDDLTMVMQVVNTLNHQTLMEVLLAFNSDTQMSKDVESFLKEIKARENYIQRGGEDGDESIVVPGVIPQRQSSIPNIIIMIFALLASVLFACQGILAVEHSVIGGVDYMVERLQVISDNTPVSPFSEEVIDALHQSGQSSVYESIMTRLGAPATSPVSDALAIEGTGQLALPDKEGAVVAQSDALVTTQSAIQSSIQKLSLFKLPTMTTGERLGLLVGKLPKQYLQEATRNMMGIVSQEVTPVFTRIMFNAAEAGIERAWNQGASGHILVRGADAVSKFFGFGSVLPIDDKTLEKGFQTFGNTLKRSLTEIYDLVQETSVDVGHNTLNNIFGYGAFSLASIALAVMQATIIGLRFAKTDAQRNGIIAVSSSILNKINSPFLMLLMATQRGLTNLYLAVVNGGKIAMPPGSVSGPGQYGGKKRKRTRKHKSHKKHSRKTKNNKRVSKKPKSILKRGGSKKQRGHLKKGTTKRRCVTFNLNRRGGKRTRRR